MKLRGLYNWQVRRLLAFEETAGVAPRPPIRVWKTRPIADQSTRHDVLGRAIHGRDRMLRRERDDPITLVFKKRFDRDYQSTEAQVHQIPKSFIQLSLRAGVDNAKRYSERVCGGQRFLRVFFSGWTEWIRQVRDSGTWRYQFLQKPDPFSQHRGC